MVHPTAPGHRPGCSRRRGGALDILVWRGWHRAHSTQRSQRGQTLVHAAAGEPGGHHQPKARRGAAVTTAVQSYRSEDPVVPQPRTSAALLALRASDGALVWQLEWPALLLPAPLAVAAVGPAPAPALVLAGCTIGGWPDGTPGICAFTTAEVQGLPSADLAPPSPEAPDREGNRVPLIVDPVSPSLAPISQALPATDSLGSQGAAEPPTLPPSDQQEATPQSPPAPAGVEDKESSASDGGPGRPGVQGTAIGGAGGGGQGGPPQAGTNAAQAAQVAVPPIVAMLLVCGLLAVL
jgi:hypothetical protein